MNIAVMRLNAHAFITYVSEWRGREFVPVGIVEIRNEVRTWVPEHPEEWLAFVRKRLEEARQLECDA